MGRWAQRRIRASTPPQPADDVLAFIIGAVQLTAFTLNVTYNISVDPTDLNPVDFSTDTALQPDTITFFSADTITLTFLADLVGSATIAYSGAAPGFLTPDSAPY